MPAHLGPPADLVARYRFDQPIFVTRPTLPRLEEYQRKIESIWRSGWLTNDGELHDELRSALGAYLGTEHLSLCCNGTVALLIALQAAGIDGGEVITTPFTFPATPHALLWNRVRPVFCDIDEKSFNLDPAQIEPHIGPQTRAILGVHVFGNPCDVDAIRAIAETHDLRVIYDAAHAMGVSYRGRSVALYGDFSVLSFHATKLFTTAEGGAIVSGSGAQRERIDFLKNFGIADAETVIGLGINGKMSELHASLGLLQLELLEDEIARRGELVELYRSRLARVPGIAVQGDFPEVRHNHSYLTILVDPERYGMDRNRLAAALKTCNVHPRKYFHPLCSDYPCYESFPSARPESMPVARMISERILCLPLYGTLDRESVEIICSLIAELSGR